MPGQLRHRKFELSASRRRPSRLPPRRSHADAPGVCGRLAASLFASASEQGHGSPEDKRGAGASGEGGEVVRGVAAGLVTRRAEREGGRAGMLLPAPRGGAVPCGSIPCSRRCGPAYAWASAAGARVTATSARRRVPRGCGRSARSSLRAEERAPCFLSMTARRDPVDEVWWRATAGKETLVPRGGVD